MATDQQAEDRPVLVPEEDTASGSVVQAPFALEDDGKPNSSSNQQAEETECEVGGTQPVQAQSGRPLLVEEDGIILMSNGDTEESVHDNQTEGDINTVVGGPISSGDTAPQQNNGIVEVESEIVRGETAQTIEVDNNDEEEAVQIVATSDLAETRMVEVEVVPEGENEKDAPIEASEEQAGTNGSGRTGRKRRGGGRKRKRVEAIRGTATNSAALTAAAAVHALAHAHARNLAVSNPHGASLPIAAAGLATMGYPSLASLASGGGAPILAHASLLTMPMAVPVPVPVPRRAVRIAPMGIVPLPGITTAPRVGVASASITSPSAPSAPPAPPPPPQNTTSASSAAFIDTSTVGSVTLNAHVKPSVARQISAGKHRDAINTQVTPPADSLTAEERTKQKRMLRNRESAARSRDKQKTRNLQLQASISKLQARRAAVDTIVGDLSDIIDRMHIVLAEHHVDIPL